MPQDIVRTTFTRYRLGGASSLAIPLAWMRVLGPFGGGPQILGPSLGATAAVSAHIGIHRGLDVRIGDILKEGAAGAAGRVFIVKQVEPQADHVDLYHSSEIPTPIPDEFDTLVKEAFWTDPDTGFVVVGGAGAGGLFSFLQNTSLPSGSSPTAADKYYQLVEGNFDVWSSASTSVAIAGVELLTALIGAQVASNSTGLFVGYRERNAGGMAELVRTDVVSGPTTTTVVATTLTPGGFPFIRIRRQGAQLRVFYKVTAGEPTLQSDWVEIFQPNASLRFSSADAIRVGHFCFANVTDSYIASWNFLRHWLTP